MDECAILKTYHSCLKVSSDACDLQTSLKEYLFNISFLKDET